MKKAKSANKIYLLYKFGLYSKEINEVRLKHFVALFLMSLSLLISPFLYGFIQNFNYESKLETKIVTGFDYTKLAEHFRTCEVNNYTLSCTNYLEKNDDLTLKVVDDKYEPLTTEFQGLAFYEDLVVFTDLTTNTNLFFRYPQTINFSSLLTSDEAASSLIIGSFFKFTSLLNGSIILLTMLTTLVIYNLIFHGCIMLILLIVKLVPAFKQIGFTDLFKIVSFSIFYPSLIFFILSVILNQLLLANLLYTFGIGLVVFVNVLALYVKNTKEVKARLDDQKFL